MFQIVQGHLRSFEVKMRNQKNMQYKVYETTYTVVTGNLTNFWWLFMCKNI